MSPWPHDGTKLARLLEVLLAGERVDPFYALMELNLATLQARVSELRRLGWPIRSIELAHPKLENERIVAYFVDTHFRRWLAANRGVHPSAYPFAEGRGKFAVRPRDEVVKVDKVSA